MRCLDVSDAHAVFVRFYAFGDVQLTDKFELVQAGGKDDGGEGGVLGASATGPQGRRGAGARSSALRAVYS